MSAKVLCTAALLAIGPCYGASTDTCTRFELSGEVQGDQEFHAVMGKDLSFRMEPTQDGWTFEIGPTAPRKDEWDQYIYPLNPPYRNRRPNMLDTSYGVLAQDVKDYDHSFWFMTERSEAPAALAAITRVLWAKNAEDSALGLKQLGQLTMGRGELSILDADIDPGIADIDKYTASTYWGAVRRIRFHVAFIVPPSFSAAPAAKPAKVPCPDLGSWAKQWEH